MRVENLRLLLLIIVFSIIYVEKPRSQNCPNSNFSAGNFSNWEGYYGHFDNPEENFGFVTGSSPRHLICKSPSTTDPNTGNLLSTLPPGESFCARLGNEFTGAEAEELRYTFPVTAENNLFIYEYAVVLEDPGHVPSHQPSFTIEVRNQDGVLFDPVCGYYYVYAQPGLPGWNTSTSIYGNTVQWKNWTTVGLDLTQLVGQTVTIVFITRDCSETGHFGYAYLTTRCDKLQLVVGFCLENSTVTVTAPPGFSYLWNNGETTQSISVVNPVPGMVDSCRLTAVNGCQVTIKATIQPTILKSDFSFTPQCSTDPVQFSDKSTINQNSMTDWVWDFGDGTPPIDKNPNPVHQFTDPGTYVVTHVTYSSDFCTDTSRQSITIPPKIIVNLGDDITLKWHGTVTLDAGNPGAVYLWSTGETTQTITIGGDHVVWVRAENASCSSTDTIVIHELPRCICEAPNAFTPNGDGQNDILYVYGSGFSSFEFLVFDRSGALVFQTVNTAEGWDGSYKGQQLGMAVYNYFLRGICIDGDRFLKKGNITLLR